MEKDYYVYIFNGPKNFSRCLQNDQKFTIKDPSGPWPAHENCGRTDLATQVAHQEGEACQYPGDRQDARRE